MTLVQLRYTVKLAQVMSYSKAADLLFITQPTLSQQIKKLEDEIGAKLFIRNTRSVTLTPAGVSFVKEAKRILSEIDSLYICMNSFDKSKPKDLNIGVTTILQTSDLPKYISDFSIEHPKVIPIIHMNVTNELEHLLNSNKIEMAVMKLTEYDEIWRINHFRKELLFKDRMNVVLPHNHHLQNHKFVSIDELKDEKVITGIIGSELYNAMVDMYYYAKVPFNISMMTNSSNIETMISFVEKGLGITFSSETVCEYFDNRDLIFKPLKPSHYKNTYIVTNKKYDLSETTNALIEYLRNRYSSRFPYTASGQKESTM